MYKANKISYSLTSILFTKKKHSEFSNIDRVYVNTVNVKCKIILNF